MACDDTEWGHTGEPAGRSPGAVTARAPGLKMNRLVAASPFGRTRKAIIGCFRLKAGRFREQIDPLGVAGFVALHPL